MKLHDKLRIIPDFLRQRSDEENDIGAGEVVYIHPRRRFVTLEYTAKNGRRFRESFTLLRRRGI